jgi:molecular chaperone Hsp33
MSESDHVVRAITQDGAFRVVAVQATEMAREVVKAQKAEGASARVLAEMVTGAVLVRESMAPDLRVQGILQGGRTRVVADAYPDGGTRGLVQGQAHIDLSKGGVLQIMRSLHNGSLQQGIVEVGPSGNVSAALMEYMQSSEQVASFIAVGALVEDGTVSAAGGYLVQLLPEVGRGPLMVMTERLSDFATIEQLMERGDAAPERLLGELLFAMPYDVVGRSPVRFSCPCSETRVMASLASLSRDDIVELTRGTDPLEIACDYCRREYRILPEKLKGLLEAN